MTSILPIFSSFLTVLALDTQESTGLFFLQRREGESVPDETHNKIFSAKESDSAPLTPNELGPASYLSATEVTKQAAPLAFKQEGSGNLSDRSTDSFSSPFVLNKTGLGSTVEITEEGYQETAALKNPDEMRAFAVRVLQADGKSALNEAALTGMIPWYDGVEGLQSLQAMRDEFARAEWVYPSNKPVSGNITELTENGYLQIAALNSKGGKNSSEDLKAFARRILLADSRSVLDENRLNGIAPYFDGTNSTQSLQALQNELRAAKWVYHGIGRTVPLSEEGYRKVAYAHDLQQMIFFARRILNESEDEEGEGAVGNGTLARIIPYFDGEIDIQDFDTLQQVLQSHKSIPPGQPSGRTALLAWFGYNEVVALKNDTEMESFVRRVLHRDGRSVLNETGLKEFVPFYSGTKETQRWNPFLTALRRASWVDPGIGRTAPLSEEGYQSVAAAFRSVVQMKSFARRILVQSGKEPFDDTQLDGLTRFFDGRESVQDFDSLTEALLDFSDGQPEEPALVNHFAKWANIERLV